MQCTKENESSTHKTIVSQNRAPTKELLVGTLTPFVSAHGFVVDHLMLHFPSFLSKIDVRPFALSLGSGLEYQYYVLVKPRQLIFSSEAAAEN